MKLGKEHFPVQGNTDGQPELESWCIEISEEKEACKSFAVDSKVHKNREQSIGDCLQGETVM